MSSQKPKTSESLGEYLKRERDYKAAGLIMQVMLFSRLTLGQEYTESVLMYTLVVLLLIFQVKQSMKLKKLSIY